MMSAPPLIHELTLEFKVALSFAEFLCFWAQLGGWFQLIRGALWRSMIRAGKGNNTHVECVPFRRVLSNLQRVGAWGHPQLGPWQEHLLRVGGVGRRIFPFLSAHVRP